MEEPSFDFILKKVVGVGKWQVGVFFLLYFLIETPFVYFPVFTLTIPVPHRCKIPFLDDGSQANLTYDDITNFAIPNKSDADIPPAIGQQYYPCSQYNVSILEPLFQERNYSSEELSDLRTKYNKVFSDDSIIPCESGCVYDTRLVYHRGTAVEHFQLVCGREHLIPTATTAYMLGQLVASLVSGFLADKYGRRKVICYTALFTYISGILVSVSPNITFLICLRFLVGYTTLTGWITGWVLLTEITTSSVRNVLISILEISFGFLFTGIFILMAFLCENWALLHIGLTLLAAPSVLILCFLPESPRWLLTNNQNAKAQKVILQAMKYNNRTDSTQEMIQFEIAKVERNVDERMTFKEMTKSTLISIFVLVKTKEIRWRTAILAFEWLIMGMSYYGITFYSVTLPGNPYLIFFLLSLGSIPANFCQLILYHKFDRKLPLMGIMAIACPVLIGLALYQNYSGSHTNVIVMVVATTFGKVLIDCLHSMFFIWTPELFPTEVRSYAMGVCSAMTRLGSACAPYVIQLGETTWRPFPFMILGILLSVCVMLNVFLPDTKKLPMPDTVEALKTGNEGGQSLPNSSMSEESL